MRCACIVIPDRPSYRRDAFATGLERLGYAVKGGDHPPASPRDVLVTWNRPPSREPFAARYERAGCTVLVAENGYIGTDRHGGKLCAMARSHHNGAGSWPVGEEDRWARLGLELGDWRQACPRGEVLVLPQRGLGEPGVAMPKGWVDDVIRRLKAVTDRPVRVRPHLGLNNPPLEPDLRGVHAAVTWGSGAAIKAIVAGIPVFHELKAWIGAGAARFAISGIENPFLGDRLPMLRRLAWAEWSAEELATGMPFERLLKG